MKVRTIPRYQENTHMFSLRGYIAVRPSLGNFSKFHAMHLGNPLLRRWGMTTGQLYQAETVFAIARTVNTWTNGAGR